MNQKIKIKIKAHQLQANDDRSSVSVAFENCRYSTKLPILIQAQYGEASASIIIILSCITHIQLTKNYMDTPQPTAEPIAVSFQSQMLFISEPAPGQISIAFDEPLANLRHQLKNHSLAKINYRTVLAGLKNTHPQIISAKLAKNEEGKYELVVTVAYEFLPEVREVFVMESRVVEKDESQRASVQNLRNYIKGMREELSTLGNIQTIAGNLENQGETDIFVALSSKRTVFTLSLNLTAVVNDLLKVQMFYYNTSTKERRSSAIIPEEGVFIYNNGKGYTEIKFLAEYEDFDMVVFKVGKSQGSYILTGEKVDLP